MDMQTVTQRARQAGGQLSQLPSQEKNKALQAVAKALKARSADIFAANQADVTRSQKEGLAEPLLKRLHFDQDSLQTVLDGIDSLIGLDDPVGQTLMATELDQGLNLYRISCPIGVIGIIFESRPDALVQISTLCLKSGNAVLLKGGSEAHETNRILTQIIADATHELGLPEGWINLMASRSDVQELLSCHESVDLLIPRGSNEFVQYIMENTKIPVLGHADGVCHLYLDQAADPHMALDLACDSKTQYLAVCNAVETILIHEALTDTVFDTVTKALQEAGITLYGCPKTCDLIGCQPVSDWHQEYLGPQVSIRLVESDQEAIDHINRHGSHHTDAIVTADSATAKRFLSQVDSANVFWNCSTRFSDGFRYGFGAEVGISTSKIHARGPVGIEGLVTYQYRLLGQGQIVADYASGKAQFTHRPLALDKQ